MGIGDQLTEQMKQAMRDRDQPTLDLVRMLKSKMTERTTAKGFAGEVDDALWTAVIGAYAKSLRKAVDQFRAVGDAGVEHVEQLEWELNFLADYLPTKADAAQTRVWVEEAVAGLGGADQAKLGAVMGAVMKGHKAEVEPQLVRQIAQELLG